MKFLKVVLKIYVGLGVAATAIFTLTMITFSGDSGHVSLSTVLIVGGISCVLGGWIFVYIPLRVLRALEDFPSHLRFVVAYVIAVPLVLPVGIVLGSIEIVEAWRRRLWANGPLDAATRRRLRNRGLAVTGTIALVMGALAHNLIAETLTTIVRGKPTWQHPFGTRLAIDYEGGVLHVPFQYLQSRYKSQYGTYGIAFAWPGFSEGSYSDYDPAGSWPRSPSTVLIHLNISAEYAHTWSDERYVKESRAKARASDGVESRFPGLREERFASNPRGVYLTPLDPSVVGPTGAPLIFRCRDDRPGHVGDDQYCVLNLPLEPGLITHWTFAAARLEDWPRFSGEVLGLIASFKTPRGALHQ